MESDKPEGASFAQLLNDLSEAQEGVKGIMVQPISIILSWYGLKRDRG